MSVWFIIQIAIDILLLFLILYIIFRNAGRPEIDIEKIKSIHNEIKDSITKSEQLASKIERDFKDAANMLAVQEVVRRKKATAATLNRPEQLPLTDKSADLDFGGEGPVLSNRSQMERKRLVKSLLAQGLAPDEISSRLSIPLPEVELIMAILGDKDKG